MKATILLIAVVTGGVAGGAASLLVGPTDDDTSVGAAAPGLGSSSEFADLRSKNASLEERLRVLEGQINMQASNRSSAVDQAPRAADQLDQAALEELLASLNQPDQPAPAGLARMVERAIEDKETREQAERDAERRAEREERLDERMNEMADKLGLDAGQKTAVRDAIWERDEARNEYFAQMRGDGGRGFGNMDRDQLRADLEDMTKKANDAISSSLSPAQFEQYEEEYGSDRWSGRGGFGGGGGRGGGRGD